MKDNTVRIFTIICIACVAISSMVWMCLASKNWQAPFGDSNLDEV